MVTLNTLFNVRGFSFGSAIVSFRSQVSITVLTIDAEKFNDCYSITLGVLTWRSWGRVPVHPLVTQPASDIGSPTISSCRERYITRNYDGNVPLEAGASCSRTSIIPRAKRPTYRSVSGFVSVNGLLLKHLTLINDATWREK